MQVHELMTPDVEVIRPDDTLQTAAKMMADIDAGILPVGENDRLVGMITDRDNYGSRGRRRARPGQDDGARRDVGRGALLLRGRGRRGSRPQDGLLADPPPRPRAG